MQNIGAILLAIILPSACGGSGGGGSNDGSGGDGIQPPAATEATVLTEHDLGMICMNREYSVFQFPTFQRDQRSSRQTR